MTIPEELGVNQDVLAEKCAKFTKEFLRAKFGSDPIDFVKLSKDIKNDFTEEEHIFMVFTWLAEKADLILNNYGDIKKGVPMEEILQKEKNK